MSLSRSLNTGTSSLRANQQRFDVISNNIANVSTHGYKSSRTNFSETFNQVYSHGRSPDNKSGVGVGGTNPYQIGLGVSVGSITHDFTQGNLESTGRPLDLALQGDGFFVYNFNGREMYSRAGALTRDKAGNVTDSTSGAFLQGYNVSKDANGRILKDASGANLINRTKNNIVIEPNTISPPGQTKNVALSGNLNSADASGAIRNTSINVYDNLGNTHTLDFTFTKAATANEYTLAVKMDDKAITIPTSAVQFNEDGTLKTPTSISLSSTDLNTALGTTSFNTSSNINVQLAQSDNVLTGLTQYSGPNTATAGEQDGYAAGTLTDLSVDDKGQIWGAFTNGQSEVLAQVVIAKFANPEAMKHEGNNFLTVTPNSGMATIGTPGESFPSTAVKSNYLEMSNVELTTEFTNMITTQRAYEAAAKTITSSDEILQTTVNLKR